MDPSFWINFGLTGLFLASFLAATFLPFSSEAVVLGMVAMGVWPLFSLFVVASLGNWLGGLSSYGLGRLGDLQRIAKWLGTAPEKAEQWRQRIERYGIWAALLCWVPIIGDPIAIALGLGRAKFWPVVLLMLLGKAGRYGVLLGLAKIVLDYF